MALRINNKKYIDIPYTSLETSGEALASAGWNKTFWGSLGSTHEAGTIDNNAWLYRTIFTHGFLAAGYKGSNPWRTVNKTWHSTEVTVYCGEQIAYTQGYTDGVFSDYNGYIVAGAGFNAATSIVCSYSLHNGTIRTFSADGYSSDGVSYGYVGHDPKNEGLDYGTAGYAGDVGGMSMNVSRVDCGGATDMKGQSGWITGGNSSSTNRLHFATEVMYSGWDSGNSGRATAADGELRGWYCFSNVYRYVTFSNGSWTAGWGSGGGFPDKTDYQGKIMSSKRGHHYIDTGNNVTLGKARFSDATGSTLSTFNKVRAYGEANNQTGQDNGYIMGHYDGQQNNHTIRQSYLTDTEVTLGAAAQPKGHYGQSSGACSSAAATITGFGTKL